MSIYDDATIFDDLLLAARRSGSPIRSAARLVRYRLRPGATESAPEPVASGIELPQVHPARVGQGRARIVWSSQFGENRELADRVLRLDLDTGSTSQWQRPDAVHLEPLFVPRPGGVEDDDGVLCVPTLADNDRASVVCVVDARTMQCVAEIDAPQVVPFGFHAAFAQA